jgi:hypothetical protein
MYEVRFKVICCVCKRDEVVQTRNVPADSNECPIPVPPFPDWKCDGLGSWMCSKCYEEWSPISGLRKR